MRRVLLLVLAITGVTAACGDGGAAGDAAPGGDDGRAIDGRDVDGARAIDAGPGACGRPRPGPDTTGVPAGTVLVPSSGVLRIETDGAIVEDLDHAGEIHVLANDVTIRRVRLTSGDYYPIRYFDEGNTGLLVEDTEIVQLGGDVTSGIAFASFTARRVNIHGGADGIKADADVLIEDSWIHDLSNGPKEHNDGVQSTGGANVTIRNTLIEGASNAAIQTGDLSVRIENFTVECSILRGGGYAIQIRGSGDTLPTGTRIVDNLFGRDSGYGPWVIDDPAPTITGNAYEDGEPIPFP